MRKKIAVLGATLGAFVASAVPSFAVDPTVTDVTTAVQTQLTTISYAMVGIVLGILAAFTVVVLAKKAPKAIRWGASKLF